MELALRSLCVSMMVLPPAFLLGAQVVSAKCLKLDRNNCGDGPRAQSFELLKNRSDSIKNEKGMRGRLTYVPYACNGDW